MSVITVTFLVFFYVLLMVFGIGVAAATFKALIFGFKEWKRSFAQALLVSRKIFPDTTAPWYKKGYAIAAFAWMDYGMRYTSITAEGEDGELHTFEYNGDTNG